MGFGPEVYRILAIPPGIEPANPSLEHELLTTGLPWTSLNLYFKTIGHCTQVLISVCKFLCLSSVNPRPSLWSSSWFQVHVPGTVSQVTLMKLPAFPNAQCPNGPLDTQCTLRVLTSYLRECMLSRPTSATPGTVAHQAPLSMRFSRQEYWSGLPFPLPGDLHDPRLEPSSLAYPALAGRFCITMPPGKPSLCYRNHDLLANI